MKIASVSMFQDKKGEMIIIPMWRDVNGVNRDSVKFKKIGCTYTEYDIGKEILYAVEISKKNEQEDSNQEVYKKASGLRSWNAFQKKYESMVLEVFTGEEWMFTRLLKQKDHSYGLTKDQVDKYTKIFSEPLSPEILGKVVLEMFDLK